MKLATSDNKAWGKFLPSECAADHRKPDMKFRPY